VTAVAAVGEARGTATVAAKCTGKRYWHAGRRRLRTDSPVRASPESRRIPAVALTVR